MHPEFWAVFSHLREFDIAITGSVLRDFDAAKDLDVLFPASQDFRQLARELGVSYRGGFDGDGGRIHSLHYQIEGVSKPVNLFQRDNVFSADDWPHECLLRNGTVRNKGAYLDKKGKTVNTHRLQDADSEIEIEIPDITEEEPEC